MKITTKQLRKGLKNTQNNLEYFNMKQEKKQLRDALKKRLLNANNDRVEANNRLNAQIKRVKHLENQILKLNSKIQ